MCVTVAQSCNLCRLCARAGVDKRHLLLDERECMWWEGGVPSNLMGGLPLKIVRGVGGLFRHAGFWCHCERRR
jgi:hypothetical protein